MMTILFNLILVGIILWAVNTFIPMDARIKQIFNVVVIILVIVWLFHAFGVIGLLPKI